MPAETEIGAEKDIAEAEAAEAAEAECEDCEDESAETVTKTGERDFLNSLHARVRKMAQQEQWPEGPGTVPELFDWPLYNATKLLQGHGHDGQERGSDRLRNLKGLLQRITKVIINESFAGTGTGAATLHQAVAALQAELRRQQQGHGSKQRMHVETTTSCDIEPMCRKVLSKLPEAPRPHVFTRQSSSFRLGMPELDRTSGRGVSTVTFLNG